MMFSKVAVLSGGKNKGFICKAFCIESQCPAAGRATNYLDMQSIEALEGVLKDYEGTVLFVSHDRAFVRAVADRLLVTGGLTVRTFEGGG